VNEKKDVMYFRGARFWLLRIIRAGGRMNSEDDQVVRQQHMAQLQGCQNLAFDMNIVPHVSIHLVQCWLGTFTDMKKMVMVINAQKKEVSAKTSFVVSYNEKVIREALLGSSWEVTRIDSITRIFLHDDIRQAGIYIPKLEFVLISDPEAGEKWSENLPVHSL